VQLDDELPRSSSSRRYRGPSAGPPHPAKANLVDEAAQCLRLFPGGNHRVYTAICWLTPKEASASA